MDGLNYHTMPGVPVQVVVVERDRHVAMPTRAMWHRDDKGHSTGDVLVSSELHDGWERVHKRRAAQILGTDLVLLDQQVIRHSRTHPSTITTRWSIAEEGGWGN